MTDKANSTNNQHPDARDIEAAAAAGKLHPDAARILRDKPLPAAAELEAEVERARKAARVRGDSLAQRHAQEWDAVAERWVGREAPAVAKVGGVAVIVMAAELIAAAQSIAARQARELMLDSHDVLEGELGKLFQSAASSGRRSVGEPVICEACGARARAPFTRCSGCILAGRTERKFAAPAAAPASPPHDPHLLLDILWSGQRAVAAHEVLSRINRLADNRDALVSLRSLLCELLLALGGSQ